MKKTSSVFLSILLLLGVSNARAQQSIFLSSGTIEFERKVNQYEQIADEEAEWKDLMKKTGTRFYTTYFNLSFSGNKTLYKPGRENVSNSEKKLEFWGDQPGEDNVIYSDYEADQVTSQKKVYETLFLIKDSARKIRWKITDENRVIAGFACRRANAIIMDSIYVVAFYTDEITTPGGPESFSGLPGMILGVAIPHKHVTWFASKVNAAPVAESLVIAPVKGKKTNLTEYKQSLKTATKDWGRWAQHMLEAAEL